MDEDRASISTAEETLITPKEKLSQRRRTQTVIPEEFMLSDRKKRRSAYNQTFDEYFLGPRELDKHSKWPMLFRIHGSCLPELVLPLLFVAAWTTGICLFSRHVHDVGISSTLLTVLGFIVGLSLSFRSTTAYERYMEGRRAWTTLTMVSLNLARNIWINAVEREENEKEDLLEKISALNLIVAFAQALKHRLRFEPYTHYSDLKDLVGHLDTFAKDATELEPNRDDEPPTFWQSWGEYLAIPMAMSNPRKMIKQARFPLGNLPLEILNHLTLYINTIITAGCFKSNGYQTQALNSIMFLNDIQGNTDRILNTPLPLAYAIAISQLTWVYILILPFQLYTTLGMLAIPGTLFAAYMILGFASIGREIENPFGHDVNDLPLDDFCNQLAVDIDIIAATSPKDANIFMKNDNNLLMHPLSRSGYAAWNESSVEDIRDALKNKALMTQNKLQPRLRRRDATKSNGGEGRYERVRASGADVV